MILIDAGIRDTRTFEAKVLFARRLAERGFQVVVDAATAPEDLHAVQKYDAVPFLADITPGLIERVLIIGADNVADELLTYLHRLQLPTGVLVTAIGRFENAQAQISTQSKLAYVLGNEPTLLDVNAIQPVPIVANAIQPLFASEQPTRGASTDTVRLFLVVPADVLEDQAVLQFLAVLANTPGIDSNVITAGFGKEKIRLSRYSSIASFGISELDPATFATMADIVAIYGPSVPGERMAGFALGVMKSGGVVVDCTDVGALSAIGAPAVRGPNDLASLLPFLRGSILNNRVDIGRQSASDPWLAANSIDRLEIALDLPGLRKNARKKPARKPRALFIPTNGVGLGHAQRCSLMAAELDNAKTTHFAAFPSCIPMLEAKGFTCHPLVQKSDQHADPYANDLLNYFRLGQYCEPGDTLVFDGGYIFSSIYRTILEKRLNAVWVRRGLWQTGQVGQTPMEREKAFSAVIVPSEAFDELNTDYSFGSNVHRVGPVVQTSSMSAAERNKFRAVLQSRFGRKYRQLVVTMLGGGQAADRSFHLQSICANLERRTDCLHLIVVWPNAKIAPGLFGWSNSRVVRSRNALQLCQTSDLLVSAAGYNTYHEVLYHQIPTIFVPQMAAYMDDQVRRAAAASDRELAVTVQPDEMLILQREVDAFLDEGKNETMRKNLRAWSLPELGTKAAAGIISGVSL